MSIEIVYTIQYLFNILSMLNCEKTNSELQQSNVNAAASDFDTSQFHNQMPEPHQTISS